MSEAKGVGATGSWLARSGRLATAMGIAVAVGTGLLSTGLSAQSRCQVQDERRLTGSATGEVSIDAGAGRLVVTGREGVDDGSGSASVSGVAAVRIQDGSGDLVVSSGRRERIRHSNIRGSLDLPPARRNGRSGSS